MIRRHRLAASKKDYAMCVLVAIVSVALRLPICSMDYSAQGLPVIDVVFDNLLWLFLLIIFAADVIERNFGRTAVYSGTIVVAYAIVVASIFKPMIRLKYFAHFDSVQWKQAAWEAKEGNHSESRICMVDDLLRTHRLVGLSRQELENLLGKPNDLESAQTKSEYLYYLGPERSYLSVDSDWLDVIFAHDKVVSAIIKPD